MRLASLALLVAFQHSSGHSDDPSPKSVDQAPWLNPPCGGVKSSKYPKLLCLGKKGEDKEYKSLWETMESFSGKHPKQACSDIEIDCEASRICTVMLAWMGKSSTQTGLRGERHDRHIAAACLSTQCPREVLASANVLNGVPGATCPHTGVTLHEVPTVQASEKEGAGEPEPEADEKKSEKSDDEKKSEKSEKAATKRATIVATTLPEATTKRTTIVSTTLPEAVVSTPLATTRLPTAPPSTPAAAPVQKTTTISYPEVNVQSLSKSREEHSSSSSANDSDVEKPKDKDRTLDVFVGCVLLMLLLMMILERLFKQPQEATRRASPLE